MESFFLSRGLWRVARVAHRAQLADPPPRATALAQTGLRTLAVPLPRTRRSVGASVSTRRFGRSVPARSGEIRLPPAGRDWPPPLRNSGITREPVAREILRFRTSGETLLSLAILQNSTGRSAGLLQDSLHPNLGDQSDLWQDTSDHAFLDPDGRSGPF